MMAFMRQPSTASIDSELLRLQATPRRVRFVAWHLWIIRLFILPHTLAGIGIIGWFFLCLFWALFGHNAPAEITAAWQTTGKKGSITYHVAYTYGDGLHKDASVGESFYRQVPSEFKRRPGLEVDKTYPATARIFTFGPINRVELITTTASYAGEVFGPLFMALFWNGILSIFLYMAWVCPYHDKQLARTGRAVLGRVTSITAGKNAKAHYTFRTTLGQEINGACARGKFQRGDAIVLYDEARPKKRNVLMLAAAYRPVI